jgi:hypothetical protein
MKLLAIKDGDAYFRFQNGRPLPCTLARASVFPMEKVEKVKQLKTKLLQEGRSNTVIVQLTIKEKIFVEPEQ